MGEKNGKVAKMSKCVISSDAGDEDEQEVVNPSPKKFRKRSNSSFGDFKSILGYISRIDEDSSNLIFA